MLVSKSAENKSGQQGKKKQGGGRIPQTTERSQHGQNTDRPNRPAYTLVFG